MPYRREVGRKVNRKGLGLCSRPRGADWQRQEMKGVWTKRRRRRWRKRVSQRAQGSRKLSGHLFREDTAKVCEQLSLWETLWQLSPR